MPVLWSGIQYRNEAKWNSVKIRIRLLEQQYFWGKEYKQTGLHIGKERKKGENHFTKLLTMGPKKILSYQYPHVLYLMIYSF